jgi:hypothetical protein
MPVKNVLKWDLNLKGILTLLFCIVVSCLICQNRTEKESLKSIRNSLALTQSFQKFDNFSTLNFLSYRKKFVFDISFGLGVNRTFFQKRFYPHLQVGLGYNTYIFKKVTFSPELNLALSSFSTIERHYLSSIQLGYLFQIGHKFSFLHRFNAGLLNEKFKNSLDNITSANTFGWQFTLGFAYAIN